MCIEKLIELLPNSVKCDTVDFKDVRLMDGRSAIRVTIDRLLTQEEKDKMTSKRFVGLDCVGFTNMHRKSKNHISMWFSEVRGK